APVGRKQPSEELHGQREPLHEAGDTDLRAPPRHDHQQRQTREPRHPAGQPPPVPARHLLPRLGFVHLVPLLQDGRQKSFPTEARRTRRSTRRKSGEGEWCFSVYSSVLSVSPW